jgi:tetratricopeptide (TPR) repeat protein
VVFLGSKSCARDAIVIFNGGRLKAGVAAAPYRVDLKLQLAKTLFYTDQLTELVEWLRPAINDNNADPEFLYYLGRSALVTSDGELVLIALERAANKGFGSAFSYFAEALRRFDRLDEALIAGLRGLEHSRSDFKAMSIVSRLLLERGETRRLWDLCVDLRARNAGNE